MVPTFYLALYAKLSPRVDLVSVDLLVPDLESRETNWEAQSELPACSFSRDASAGIPVDAPQPGYRNTSGL